MAISRAQLLKELVPGLNALFGLEYKRYAEESKDVFTTETSERSFEEETKVTGFGPASPKAKPRTTKRRRKPTPRATPTRPSRSAMR